MAYWSRVPSVKTLMQRLEIDKIKAKKIRSYMKGEEELNCPEYVNVIEHQVDTILNAINGLLNGHGVEVIRREEVWISHFYQNINLLYVNLGDTYKNTIVYDTENERFLCSSWGVIIESWNN